MPFINKIHRSGSCIYCIKNTTKNKVYIGQSTYITFRRESHRHKLLTGKHPNQSMQNDFNSGDIFEITALEYFPKWVNKETLNGKEYAYIKKYKSDTQGYNINSAPLNRSKCKAQIEKYKLSPEKVYSLISHINEQNGLTYLRIHDLCHTLNCKPSDIMDYIPDEE